MIDYKNLRKIAVDPKTGIILDKQAMVEMMDEIFLQNGLSIEPLTVTAEELHARMLADGVKPEDNIGSRDIIRQRYGCDDED